MGGTAPSDSQKFRAALSVSLAGQVIIVLIITNSASTRRGKTNKEQAHLHIALPLIEFERGAVKKQVGEVFADHPPSGCVREVVVVVVAYKLWQALRCELS